MQLFDMLAAKLLVRTEHIVTSFLIGPSEGSAV